MLVFAFDFLSHYTRCMLLASWCKDEVEFIFGHSKRYEAWLKTQGWPTFAYDDTDAEVILEYSTRMDFRWMSDVELERVFTLQVAIIKEYKPDVVLGDASMTLNMAAEYCGVPCVKLVNGYMSKYYAPGRPLPTVHPAYALLSKLPGGVQRWLTHVGEQIVLRWTHAPFKRVRKKYGLRERASFLDELEGETTLICDLPSLFPQHNLPPSVHVLGPLFYRETQSDESVDDFVANDRLNILVSLGSTGDVDQFRWLCDDAFSDCRVIMTGRNHSALRAPHIRSRRFVNHNLLLPQVDCLICHGGNGSIYQALWHGVPVLACPNFFEQEYNMERVCSLHLGDVLDPKQAASHIALRVKMWCEKKNNEDLRRIRKEIQDSLDRFERG